MSIERRYRAGESLEDLCRACKADRMHTVIAADAEGRPIRVSCGFCRSEHHYRGGPRQSLTPTNRASGGTPAPAPPGAPRASVDHIPFPLVSDRERTMPAMTIDGNRDLEQLLRRVIREEAGLTPVAPAEKWRGGTLVLRPGTPGLQEKGWPIETFFHKVVMVRNRLRTLEQQINAADLPDEVKLKVQAYISGCYGSLTSFNVLFADEADQVKGAGTD